MNKYDRILKELKKGNAVLMEVGPKSHNGWFRYRLVTPNNSLYATIEAIYNSDFHPSCFMCYKPTPTGPAGIIHQMKRFDRYMELKIYKFIVLGD